MIKARDNIKNSHDNGENKTYRKSELTDFLNVLLIMEKIISKASKSMAIFLLISIISEKKYNLCL